MDISVAEGKMSALAVRSSDHWGRHFHTTKAAETNNEEKMSQVADKDRPVLALVHTSSLFLFVRGTAG